MSDYLHYIHGRNPMGLHICPIWKKMVLLSQSNSIYHGWFTDEVLCGRCKNFNLWTCPGICFRRSNKFYSLTDVVRLFMRKFEQFVCNSGTTPKPANSKMLQRLEYRLALKNSWEITENSIYVQASYLFLLSSKINAVKNMLSETNRIRIT